MEESSTYQWILRKGSIAGARRQLVATAGAKFGPPDAAARAALDAITDASALESLGPRLWTVSSWEELLGLPAPQP